MVLHFYKKALSSAALSLFSFASIVHPAYAYGNKLSPQSFNHMYNLAAGGHISALRGAMHRGMNIDVINGDGDTGLCVAAKRKSARAYNTFRAVGANPDHPCTWDIADYDEFGASRSVQAGAIWKSGNYVRPVYGTASGSSNMWAWIGGGLLLGSGAALAFSGGGGGGSGEENPENPDNPDIPEEGEGSEENFVKTALTPLNNSTNLLQSGDKREGAWGGIYSKNQSIINSGNIILNSGSNGVGIMSCLTNNLDSCLADGITTAGGNINNSGIIKITADNSFGILATTLGTLENGVLTGLNTLSSSAQSISMNGKNNTGIALIGNGNINNSSAISLKGEASHSYKQQDSNNSGWGYFQHIDLASENVALYYNNTNAGYELGNSEAAKTNTITNSGAISVALTTNKKLENSSTLVDGQREFLSVAGISALLDNTKGKGNLAVNNTGNIDVSLKINEDIFNDANVLRRLYWAVGLSATNTNYANPLDKITVNNSGKISLSGNANMFGIIVNGAVLENKGDIFIDMNSQKAADFRSFGISAHNSIINQYANIDYAISGVGGDFYAAALENSTLNIKNGANVKGNIVADKSVLNNSGNISSENIIMENNSVFNNLQGGVATIGSARVSELNNAGEINGIKKSGSNVDEIILSGSKLHNAASGTINASKLEFNAAEFINAGKISTESILFESANGENSTFTNNGEINAAGKDVVIGVVSSGANSTIINNNVINVTNSATEATDTQTASGFHMTGGRLEMGANSTISVKSSLQSGTFGAFLLGETSGFNQGHLFVEAQEGAMGIFAKQTATEGFENSGVIEVNSFSGAGMFASGGVSSDPSEDEYVKLVNSGKIYMYGAGSSGMLAVGSKSSAINSGDIYLQADQMTGMQARNQGEAINQGRIHLASAALNYGMFAAFGGVIVNAADGVIEDDAASMQHVGMFLQGNASGRNEGVIRFAGTNAMGVFAQGTGLYGFVNSGSIELTGDDSVGMAADGYVDGGENDRYVKLVNEGTISVTGKKGIGMYARGVNSVLVNNGTITVDETTGTEIVIDSVSMENRSRAFVLKDGATFVNKGTLVSEGELNLDSWRDAASLFVAGKDSVIQAEKVVGKIAAGADITTGSNADKYVSSGAIKSQNSAVDLLSNSAMFMAQLQENSNDEKDIVLTRRAFNEVLQDENLAAYLEQNYQNNNRIDLFDSLKNASTLDGLALAADEQLGRNFVPTLAYQNQQRMKYFNKTMEDLVLDNPSDKDERVLVTSNNYVAQTKAQKGALGYEDTIFGVSGLFDKALSPRFRYGIGLGIYRTTADFDGRNTRKDVMAQIYNPYLFNAQNFGVLIMPYLGYSRGEYKRFADTQKHNQDIDVYYYGLSNRAYLKTAFAGLEFEPTVEVNLSGAYQDSLNENEGLSVKAQNTFSTETGVGAYVHKIFDFGQAGSLKVRGGAMYYYELNDNAYDAIKAHMFGMDGTYQMSAYNNRRSRGIMSLKADYRFADWSVYGEVMRLLEHNDNMVYNAGIKFSF